MKPSAQAMRTLASPKPALVKESPTLPSHANKRKPVSTTLSKTQERHGNQASAMMVSMVQCADVVAMTPFVMKKEDATLDQILTSNAHHSNSMKLLQTLLYPAVAIKLVMFVKYSALKDLLP